MKNLNIKTRCPKPFDTITIDKDGNCFACECSGWLPVVVGNLKVQTLEEIVGGERIRQVQATILDGTYANCKEELCSWLLDERPEKKLWTNKSPVSKLKQLRLGIDDSCNLSCPSCRKTKIFEKRGVRLKSRLKIAEKIIAYIRQITDPIKIHIGSDGDPFASLVYRYFLKNSPRKSNISFSIQTNGLLIEKMYMKNKWLFDHLDTVGLSVDGCSEEVYEKLRRGGKFRILISNLEFLAKIKKHHRFQIVFHCVVQKENVHQLEDYTKFAEGFLADKIWFNKIVDWKTYADFEKEDVSLKNNKYHHVLKEQLGKIRNHRLVEFPTLDIE